MHSLFGKVNIIEGKQDWSGSKQAIIDVRDYS